MCVHAEAKMEPLDLVIFSHKFAHIKISRYAVSSCMQSLSLGVQQQEAETNLLK